MRADREGDLELEERAGRILSRPVRDALVPPFSEIEARLEQRSSTGLVAAVLLAVVVLALVLGNALAQRRAQVGEPAAVATPAASAPPWRAQLIADVQRIGLTAFRPLVPSDVATAVRAAAEVRTACGLSTSVCLAYHFFGGNNELVLDVLEGPAGCCLDAARPGAVKDIDIRPGVRAQYEAEPPQLGGPILWWVENTDRGMAYIALSSPVLTKDDLIRAAASMRPLLGSATASSAPTATPRAGIITRPVWQAPPSSPPVLVSAVPEAGTIGISFGGSWWYDGRSRAFASLPPMAPQTEHRAPVGTAVAVEHLEPTVPGSPLVIAKELAIRDGGAERVIYRTPGVAFYWSSWSPDGKYVALWEIDQFSGSADMDGRPLVVVDVQTGARADLGKTLLWGTTAWAAPHTLAYISGMGREPWDTKTLRLWTPERGAQNVTPPTVAAFSPSWTADGRYLYFVSGADGTWDPVAAAAGKGVGDRRVSVYDTSTGAVRSVANPSGYVVEGVRPSRDGAHLLELRRQTAVAKDIRSIPAVDLGIWLTDANGADGTELVSFPGYGLDAYGYVQGPTDWTWSE